MHVGLDSICGIDSIVACLVMPKHDCTFYPFECLACAYVVSTLCAKPTREVWGCSHLQQTEIMRL